MQHFDCLVKSSRDKMPLLANPIINFSALVPIEMGPVTLEVNVQAKEAQQVVTVQLGKTQTMRT